jgi:hypothetical protein
VVGVVACLCQPASAADGQGWTRFLDAANPYLSVGYAHDSNLFRIDDEALSTDAPSDEYALIQAGFDSNITVSQQRFELNGEASRNIYNTFEELDHTFGNATAVWHWSAGGSLTGTVGYKYTRSLRDFANQLRLPRIIDIRSEDRYLASADIDLPGNWKLGIRGDLADVSFTTTDTLDLERVTGGTALDYVSAAGNVIGIDAEFVTGDYETETLSDFDEYTVGPKLMWRFGSKTRLDAKVGYTDRDATEPNGSDHAGVTGRIALNIEGEDAKLVATVWREISNLSDEIADFAVIHGISLEPGWQLSPRVGLRLFASYEDRDFEVVEFGEDRQDDVYTGRAFLDWAIGRYFTVSAGINAQSRSSTRALQDYDFQIIELRITAGLPDWISRRE